MKIVPEIPKRAYINVMELLVAEEVGQQIKALPPRVVKYLKVVEVETYALNRLPSLYASSERGWQHQYDKAKREMHNQIKSAVRQALAAVQVDPLRSSAPLQINDGTDVANGALDSLRDLLKQPDLTWDGVINRLKGMIATRPTEATEAVLPSAETSHRTRYRHLANDYRSSSPDPTPPPTRENHPPHWRPGTYGTNVGWQRRQGQETKTTDFDWGDSRYSK